MKWMSRRDKEKRQMSRDRIRHVKIMQPITSQPSPQRRRKNKLMSWPHRWASYSSTSRCRAWTSTTTSPCWSRSTSAIGTASPWSSRPWASTLSSPALLGGKLSQDFRRLGVGFSSCSKYGLSSKRVRCECFYGGINVDLVLCVLLGHQNSKIANSMKLVNFALFSSQYHVFELKNIRGNLIAPNSNRWSLSNKTQCPKRTTER